MVKHIIIARSKYTYIYNKILRQSALMMKINTCNSLRSLLAEYKLVKHQ